jgi:hypothetical protein
LLQQSDIVTIHLPLDASTRGLVGARALALMKPDALLVHTARGGIVDEQALQDALARQRLGGAAFDVFAVEPPVDAGLLRLPTFDAPYRRRLPEAVLAMGQAAIAGLRWPGSVDLTSKLTIANYGRATNPAALMSDRFLGGNTQWNENDFDREHVSSSGQPAHHLQLARRQDRPCTAGGSVRIFVDTLWRDANNADVRPCRPPG